jgi:hypothetical protein
MLFNKIRFPCIIVKTPLSGLWNSASFEVFSVCSSDFLMQDNCSSNNFVGCTLLMIPDVAAVTDVNPICIKDMSWDYEEIVFILGKRYMKKNNGVLL